MCVRLCSCAPFRSCSTKTSRSAPAQSSNVTCPSESGRRVDGEWTGREIGVARLPEPGGGAPPKLNAQ